MSAKKGSLDTLRARARRAQFIIGLGFLSLMLGAILSGSLAMRLSQRLQALPGSTLRMLVGVVLEELWVLAVLPVLCYGAARIVELRPLSTALGGALSGLVFVLALEFVREGTLWTSAGWRVQLLRAVAFGLGVWLSHRAVVRARAASAQRADEARAQAEARKSEYDEFLREAERDGERVAQREAERAAAVARTDAPAPAEPASTEAAPAEAVSAEAAPAEAPAPVQKASGS